MRASRSTKTAQISGGEFADRFRVNLDARVAILGGLFHPEPNQLTVETRAYLQILGGRIQRSVAAYGGDAPYCCPSLQIAGGHLQGDTITARRGRVDIFGGLIEGIVLSETGGDISIFGRAFNLPLGQVAALSGTLSGTLGDGTPISVDFARASSATITLSCGDVGSLPASSASLASDQDNDCEDWSGVMQSGDDLSRAGLRFVDLSSGDVSGGLLVDADLLFANLSSANLSGADVVGARIFGATYDESTLFPSGNTYDNPPWGLDGGIEPWNAGMIPAPEPSVGLMLLVGALGLAGLAALKG
jgi:hypothetical protein